MTESELLNWKQRIRLWALERGLIGFGITTADKVTKLAGELERRLHQGLATPFEQLDPALRTDPRLIWPACQSVGALAYPLPISTPPFSEQGSLARSAAGHDYHAILTEKLKSLTGIIMAHGWPTAQPRFQVDTGPLVERAFAARAGIGWLGRNRQLIVPGYGSFVALALVLFDQPLPPDQPLADRCGKCRACVAACPARVLEEKEYNGRECISYLTQSKELLSAAQIAKLSGRIFGCDACQEVCPHNRERLHEENYLSSSYPHRGVDLWQVLTMSKQEFQDRYQLTAAGWRGKTVLQRNALIALRQKNDPGLSAWEAKQKEAANLSPLLRPYL